MPNEEHFAILGQGKKAWNEWRKANLEVRPDLSKAFLNERDLCGFDLSGANLYKASLNQTELRHANLSNANLCAANLSYADLGWAEFIGATLDGTDLICARLVETNFSDAQITNCYVYGISVWGIRGTPREISNLIITRPSEPTITVGNLQLAQFIYLLLDNKKIRDVLDVATSKVVLILGRFKPEYRKKVLDTIRDELRKPGYDYVPVVFDFPKSPKRNYRDTVKTLALMSRFVIADITSPKVVLQELETIASIGVPIQPIISSAAKPANTFYEDFIANYCDRVLLPHRYRNIASLIASMKEKVIAPAEAKAEELEERRKREMW